MRTLVQRLLASFRDLQRFALYDIWQIGTPGEKLPRGFFVKQIRVAILLGRPDGTDEEEQRAEEWSPTHASVNSTLLRAEARARSDRSRR